MAGELIGREQLDRIIRRAAELQAHERDIGEGLTRDELLALGKDVGIPVRYLRQAMLEEQTRSLEEAPHGLLARLAGPGFLAAERVVGGDRAVVDRAVAYTLEHEESLQVRRRFPDRTTWEPKRGALASIQRALSAGGKRYALTKAAEVGGQVTQLEPGFCHVRLTADVRNLRGERVGGAAAMVVVGAAGTAGMLVGGFLLPVALLPAVAFAAGAVPVVRSHRRDAEQVATALEQVLDRLEHGEIKADRLLTGPRPSAFVRMADEIKKTLEQL